MASKRTRRRPAAAARTLATGISGSAFLAMVAGFGHASQANSTESTNAMNVETSVPAAVLATADETTTTSVVVQEIRRTVYVDEFGNPVPAPVTTLVGVAPTIDPAAIAAAFAQPTASADAATPGAPAPVRPPQPASGATTGAGSQSPTPAVAQPPAAIEQPAAPVNDQPAAPVETQPPAPAPAPAPAPVQTQPPAPVATQPPPPPPPACEGSQCG